MLQCSPNSLFLFRPSAKINQVSGRARSAHNYDAVGVIAKETKLDTSMWFLVLFWMDPVMVSSYGSCCVVLLVSSYDNVSTGLNVLDDSFSKSDRVHNSSNNGPTPSFS